MPVAANVSTVMYDPDVFDAINNPYPDENWDSTQYIDAIQKLVEQDENGITLTPAFMGYNRGNFALMHSLLQSSLHDPTSILISPAFDNPELIDFAENWASLYISGADYNPHYSYADFQYESPSFTIDRMQATIGNPNINVTLLPNSRASLTVTGFAVSGQTHHPEAAYRLTTFLANDSRVADAVLAVFGSITHAKTSYPEGDEIDAPVRTLGSLSPENEALLEQALQNAIPISELHFFHYFNQAMLKIANEGVEPSIALWDMQIEVEQALAYASGLRGQIADGILAPPPDTALGTGEIALRFWMDDSRGVVNQTLWDRFIEDFVANDPHVSVVSLDRRPLSLERATQEYDCFYLTYNALSVINLDELISLDPLMSADSNFNPDELIPNILSQVEQDHQIWGYPLTVNPLVIWQDTQSSIAWQTFDQFYHALNDWFTYANDEAGLVSPALQTTLLMLISSNGGMPIDFRQESPTIDFLNHSASIQQVLDLARSGVIHYEALARITSRSIPNNSALIADTWTSRALNLEAYQPVLFPDGMAYQPLSFDLGVAYINRLSSDPDACYRLIGAISQQSNLLEGLPVRHTTIDYSFNPDDMQLYEAFVSALDRPDALLFPYRFQRRDSVLGYWLFRAFDRYVLDHANLEEELMQAERFARDYLTCVESLPLRDFTHQGQRAYNQQFVDCALQVDPTASEGLIFGG